MVFSLSIPVISFTKLGFTEWGVLYQVYVDGCDSLKFFPAGYLTKPVIPATIQPAVVPLPGGAFLCLQANGVKSVR